MGHTSIGYCAYLNRDGAVLKRDGAELKRYGAVLNRDGTELNICIGMVQSSKEMAHSSIGDVTYRRSIVIAQW